MIQCDNGLDAICTQFINKVAIILESLFVYRAGAVREYPAPRDGEAIDSEAHLLHQCNVFLVVVILVACHFGCGKAIDLIAVLIDDILLAQLFAILLSSALHLICTGGSAPQEILRERLVHYHASLL